MADTTTTPAAGPSVGKVAVDTLKLIVGMAASPGGLSLATSLLGAANPAILIAEQFGVRLLGPLLATWSLPDIDEATLAQHLASKGYKVEPFDPMTGFK